MAGAAATPALAATNYIDNANGTVTDQNTALVWKRCAEGQTWTGSTCSGTPTPYTWSQADALTASFAGYSDWRLPSISDLQTIVDTTAFNPTINATAFPDAPSAVFWSDTTDVINANNGLYVSFLYGNSSSLNKTNTFLARLVRGAASTTGGGGTGGGGTGSLSIVPSLEIGWNLLGNDFTHAITVATLFGDATVVNTVWKWDPTVPGWQFYTPSLTAAALQTYAASKGYGVLSTINPGEGFWVSAKIKATLATQTGEPFSLAAAGLITGWNLAATADDISPSEFNRRLSVTPPTPGVVASNLTTLWAWDISASNWYFYAPSLERDGTLTSYIASQGYLDFTQRNRTLGKGTGFWVNNATTNLTIAPTLTLALTVGGATVTSLSHTVPTTVSATVTDANGAAVPNAVVAFSTTDVSLATFSPATALTNAAGVASVSVNPTSLTAAGASTITATSQVGTTAVSGSIAYSVTAASATSAPSLTISFSNNAVLNSSTPVVVTATVRDSTGAPVNHALVEFNNTGPTLASLNYSYYFYYTPSAGNTFRDYTNAAGVVTGALVASLTEAGTGTIIASSVVDTTAVTDSKNFTVTAPSLSLALTVGGVPVTTLANGPSTTVTATVTDAAGNPVPNAVVAFATSDITLATFAPATALTNAAGVASVNLNPASTTAAGAATITATTHVGAATVAGTMGYSVVAAGAPTTTPNLTLTLSKTVLSSNAPARVTATVTDANGSPVQYARVTFTNSAPALASLNYSYYSFYSGSAGFEDSTDAAGVAAGNLIPSLTAAGTGTVVASSVVGATAVTSSIDYSVTAPSLSVALTSGGATVTSITSGTPVTATATVLDAAGLPVPGAIVSFETDPNLTTIAPTTATALTDTLGVATVTLSPASLTAAGAGAVIATSQVGTTPVTGTIGYSVGAAVVTVSPVSFGANPLSAFGTTSVTVTVSSNGIPVTVPQNVSFTSSCASSGKAALTASVTTLNGIATASYRDNGCAGDDTITASVSGIASSAATLTVTPPTTGSIRYVSATPASITLKGMGGAGRQESAQLIFKVVDTGGNPIGGKTVDFSLTTQAGGIALTTATAISDPATGQVVVGVSSGAVSTPVRVIASTLSGGSTLTTQSDELSITTGIPDQDSFSLSATKYNIEGWNYDGESTTITARLADHFNNPVPDGTAVVFIAEGGMVSDTNQSIKPVGSCTTVNSACAVTLTSQNPKVDGRVTVLAYAVGTESFTDLNGNGLADQLPLPIGSSATGEMIDAAGATTDMSEAFLDYNEDGVRDPLREPYADFNGSGQYDPPDGIINTMVCDHSVPAGTSVTACPTQQYRHVRGSLVVVFSGSDAVITINNDAPIALPSCNPATGLGASYTFLVTVLDLHGNAMPVGTRVAFSRDNGTITSSASYTVPNTAGCRAGSATCPASAGSATFGDISVTMKSDATFTAPVAPAVVGTCTDATGSSGVFTVTVTTPNGDLTTSTMTVTD